LPFGSAPPHRRAILAIAVGAVTIDTALLGLIAPLLPEIEQRTGAGDGALGLALAAYAVPIVLLSLPLGHAADAFGRRALLIAGLLFVAVGSVLVAISDTIGVLLAARAVQGVGSAASWISALALVSDTAPPGRRGEALGVALGATSAGAIAGPALGGVTADLFSFEAPFLIFCGLALALLFAALAVLPREAPRVASAVPALSTIIRATRSGIGAWAAAIMFGAACLLGLVEVVAPLDLDARFGLSSSAIGLLFAASIAVDAALSPFGGRWGDRRGRRAPAIAGLVVTGGSMLALAFLPGVGGTAVALGIYGAGFSLMMTASVPWLDEVFTERDRGLAYGVQNLVYAGGYAIGPILGGLLLGAADADLAYGLAAAALAIGTVVLAIRSRGLATMPGVPRNSEVAPDPDGGGH
jgi:MFS transporter, DHA1 family, solute carrier family 18 (vesicular amine transporter), member 1/2